MEHIAAVAAVVVANDGDILCLTFSSTLDVIVMVFNVLCYPNNVSKYLSTANTRRAQRKRNKKKRIYYASVCIYTRLNKRNSNPACALPNKCRKAKPM